MMPTTFFKNVSGSGRQILFIIILHGGFFFKANGPVVHKIFMNQKSPFIDFIRANVYHTY